MYLPYMYSCKRLDTTINNTMSSLQNSLPWTKSPLVINAPVSQFSSFCEHVSPCAKQVPKTAQIRWEALPRRNSQWQSASPAVWAKLALMAP